MNVVKNYNRKKKMNTLSIVIISLVVAFGINFFIINNTDLSKNLKTNLLENSVKNDLGDIYIESIWNDLILKTNNSIADIENLSFSITYNPENIKISNIIPKLNWEILNVSNTPWLSTIILEYSEVNNIKPWDKILTIKTIKSELKTENINIVNANFTDSENNTFELTTSWITF